MPATPLHRPLVHCLSPHDCLEHRDVADLRRIDGQWVVAQNDKIGEFPGSDRALDILFEILLSSVDGDRSQGFKGRDAFVWSENLIALRQAVHADPDQLQRIDRRNRGVVVHGESNAPVDR